MTEFEFDHGGRDRESTNHNARFAEWKKVIAWLAVVFGDRAVFKWLLKNQHHSNYSDQSQHEQTARWTNYSS